MRLYLLSAFLFSSYMLFGQNVEDVFTGLNKPSGLDIHDNVLYVSQEDTKSISSADLSVASTTVDEVITLAGKDNPFILVNDGTYLYYSNYKEGYIARIKMGIDHPMPEMILENLTHPAGLAIRDKILYFGHNSNKISKINLAESSPTVIDIASGLAYPINLGLSGNYLFVVEFNGNKISKINLATDNPTPKDFLVDLDNPGQLAMSGNELFFGEFSGGKISKVDITTNTLKAEVLAENLQNPTGLAISGTTLYFCQLGAGKISKIEGVVTNTHANTNSSIN